MACRPVNRDIVSPSLIRVFITTGGHRRPQDFERKDKLPKEEVQIYAWNDTDLRELTELLKEVYPPIRKHGVRISYALIYPKRSRYASKVIGRTFSFGRSGDQDRLTLYDARFAPGDYLDVSIVL
eukprot:TRINITY_DN6578_c0_g1_i2.p1 TRINITY_DN6578_c0_g1~~TRINITY_DN6578_c0_g1_i2.p1  ORF type:complete len:125 (-),score=10.63 TRINITY_DN6578_c0_g1_i2:15-389(-)